MGRLLFLVVLAAGPPAPVAPKKSVSSVRRAVSPLRAPSRPRKLRPPRVPEGIDACTSALRPTSELPRATGEALRYLVDVDGLSVGTIDFKIEQRGRYAGQVVTEYRSLFELDALVSAFVAVAGKAAALVPDEGFWPVKTMNDYVLKKNHYQEDVTYESDGKMIASKRSKNGKAKEIRRRFNDPVLDFVSGFYAMRTMVADTAGCTIIYGNQRAYTIWVTPDGQEKVSTPVGARDADRYRIRYASERSKKPLDAVLWLGQGPERVPYRAEIKGKHHLVARIHIFEKGDDNGALVESIPVAR